MSGKPSSLTVLPSRPSTRPGRGGCNVGVDPLAPSLPVAGTGVLAGVRKSRNARLRAGILIGVHVLILVHIVQYIVSGRTLSPVEPSESMYTIELGRVNAGFIFFALALVSTLLFGRFFCGWGCHIVAMQDFCAWLMKKAGIRPRPLRSRLLLLVPVALALYMFVWPTFRRLVLGIPPDTFPGFSNHLVTADFWRTFAGPTFAVLTILTCGFAAVYVLGAKGFCAYGCPYGALFGAADRFSVGRIVVSDACEQCGHCTATCTSNVRVHEEVRLHGMVVDTGCMKCMDCVSVCPKGALSFAFARPSLFRRRSSKGEASRKYVLGLGEELGLLAVCFGATLAFRGLYDGPPLLMAVGLGGVTAYLALILARLLRRSEVRLQNLLLKSGGRLTRPGLLFAAGVAVWLLFTVHSGFVQWHRTLGSRAIDRTLASRSDVLSGAAATKSYPEAHARAAAAAWRHLSAAERWGLASVVEVKLGLAWCHLLRGEEAAGEKRLREAIAMAPSNRGLRQDLVDLFLARARTTDAAGALREKIAASGRVAETAPELASVDAGLAIPGAATGPVAPAELAADHFALGDLLAVEGRLEEAATEFAACVALAPASAGARYNLGGALRRLGRSEAAIAPLRAAADLAPNDPDVQVELGLALMDMGRNEEAIAALRRAIVLAPDRPESREHLPDLIRRLGG